MENKEVEGMINEIHKKVGLPLLDFERKSIQMDIYMLRTKFDELEKDNKWLEQQLIAKNFENPPLKFEELEEGMWVWDNSVCEKSYAQIKRKIMGGDDLIVAMKQDENDCNCLGRLFEDNRFYRREVIK